MAETFRKRFVEVRAIRWTGDNIEAIFEFMDPEKPGYMSGFKNADDLIATPAGVASKGDWIIRPGERNEFGVLSDAEFAATYERVEVSDA